MTKNVFEDRILVTERMTSSIRSVTSHIVTIIPTLTTAVCPTPMPIPIAIGQKIPEIGPKNRKNWKKMGVANRFYVMTS